MHACLCDSVSSVGLAGLVEAGSSVKMRRDMRFLTPSSPPRSRLYIIYPRFPPLNSAFLLTAFNGALDFSPLKVHLFCSDFEPPSSKFDSRTFARLS